MSQSISINKLLKEHKGPNGVSLYDHLCAVLEKILRDPSDVSKFENFEQISSFIKHNNLNYNTPKTDKEVNQQKDYSTELTNWYNECLAMLEKLTKENSKGKKEPVKKLGAVPNLLDDAKILEMAGISFGEEETYLLSKSLTKLAAKTNAKELRFWGKILGTQADYYVAEGLLDNEYSDDIPTPDTEPPGTGCNRLTFWVTNNVLDDWFELPLVTPEQIRVARQIKHIFSGDLEAPVLTYPSFPGKEKHYLKAQIVRITFANVLVPKDYRKTNDDDPKIEALEFVEDYKYPTWEELVDPGTWQHYHPNILESGRVRHYIPPTVKEEDKEEYENQLAENDPYLDRLLPITEDKLSEKFTQEFEKFQFFANFRSGEEDKPLWRVRVCGESQIYSTEKDDGQTSYAVVTLKNILWPGAVTVASATNYVNIYVGYGHKLTTLTVDPFQPGDTKNDPEDVEEFPEPYPAGGPPEELEPDTDKPADDEGEEEDQ